MRLVKILKFIYKAEHPHFLSVDKETYFKWSWLIKSVVGLNKSYKSCEIFRKKYKIMEDFVVIGLKYNGKNVKRISFGNGLYGTPVWSPRGDLIAFTKLSAAGGITK